MKCETSALVPAKSKIFYAAEINLILYVLLWQNEAWHTSLRPFRGQNRYRNRNAEPFMRCFSFLRPFHAKRKARTKDREKKTQAIVRLRKLMFWGLPTMDIAEHLCYKVKIFGDDPNRESILLTLSFAD